MKMHHRWAVIVHNCKNQVLGYYRIHCYTYIAALFIALIQKPAYTRIKKLKH